MQSHERTADNKKKLVFTNYLMEKNDDYAVTALIRSENLRLAKIFSECKTSNCMPQEYFYEKGD